MSNTQPPNGPNSGEPYFGGGDQPQQPETPAKPQPGQSPQDQAPQGQSPQGQQPQQGQSQQAQSWQQQPQQQYGGQSAPQGQAGQYGGQGQYGAASPYQQGYGGQPGQQKKSKTPLVIGLVVGVLVIAAAVVGLVFFLGDDDGDDSAGDDKLSGETLEGDGYSYTLAEDWNDSTEAAGAAGSSLDSVSSLGDFESQNAQATVLVEVTPAGGQSAEDLRETWETNLSAGPGVEPERLDDTEIDGEDAFAVRFQADNSNGVEVVQLAYLVVKDDTAYTIAFSTRADEEDERTEEFEQMRGSWNWE